MIVELPTPCYQKSAPYDTLLDTKPGSGPWRRARKEARGICNGCPVITECLTENADEDWAKAVLGVPIAPNGCSTDNCEGRHKAKGLCDTHYRNSRKDAA